MNPEQIRAAVEAAKAKLAAKGIAVTQVSRVAAPASTPAPKVELPKTVPTPIAKAVIEASPQPIAQSSWSWNAKQTEAINNGVLNRSFVLIGAAGTGKTTTLRGMLQAMLERHLVPMLKSNTEYLRADTPGIALVSFTRRAVRNIAKQMPEALKTHCLTIHKLLEFGPEYYDEVNAAGDMVKKMRFVPARNAAKPLPRELTKIVVDESSMVSIELFELLLDALPNPHAVQFIFLGDLNQLPPVYGHPVLGQKLLSLPIVELTEVYRQALESPIISLALAVKNNNFAQFNKDVVDLWTGDKFVKPDGKKNYMAFDAKDLSSLIDRNNPKKPAMVVIEKPGRGKVTLQVWKKRFDQEVALAFMKGQLGNWIETGYYDPDEDLVLCPWNKAFGAIELNKSVADKLAKKRGVEVHEIIAGFEKHYLAVGDKVLVDKMEAIITDISVNPKYMGKRPAKASKDMDRWGNHADQSIALSDFAGVDIDALLENLGDVTDRKNQASHIVKVRMLDSDTEEFLDKAAQFSENTFGFAYVITVHKAQGSECRKVFFITDYCHSAMCFRELVYTGVTRAAEELHIILSPMMLSKAASRPRIQGDTLEAKLKFYEERLKERIKEKVSNDDE